jgi:hypothetical protein
MKPVNYNFIVGIGRSGTTLLMSMLNAHPSIQGTPEVNFFNFFYGSWKNKKSFDEKDYRALEKYLSAFKNAGRSSGFSWDMASFKNEISRISEINFGAIYKAFYKSFLYNNEQKDISYNFDKNPINTLFLESIINSLPNSKFIFLVRDPRANYLSRKEKQKRRVANVYKDSLRWNIYNNAALKAVKDNPSLFYVLRYEDLVENPEAKMKELARFFDFPFDDKLLTFHENVKEVSLKQVAGSDNAEGSTLLSKYEKLSKPINTDRLHVWKEKLTENEIAVCSAICAKTANKLGYAINEQKAPFNYFKYVKGLALAKLDYYKNFILFYVPLSIKLTRIKPD